MNVSLRQTITGLFLLLFPTLTWAQQTGGIKGKIISSDGEPVPYVTVSLKNEHRTVITDDDGYYTLRNVRPGDHTLVISHAGLQTREQPVHVTAVATAGADLT